MLLPPSPSGDAGGIEAFRLPALGPELNLSGCTGEASAVALSCLPKRNGYVGPSPWAGFRTPRQAEEDECVTTHIRLVE